MSEELRIRYSEMDKKIRQLERKEMRFWLQVWNHMYNKAFPKVQEELIKTGSCNVDKILVDEFQDEEKEGGA